MVSFKISWTAQMTDTATNALAKIAIAVPAWHSRSETFIRQHVDMLAPGNTALITFGGEGIFCEGPMLRLRLAEFGLSQEFTDKLRWYISLFGNGTMTPISAADRLRLSQFIAEHRVSTILAEYGVTGSWLASAGLPAQVRLFVHFHGHDASAELTWQRRYSYSRMARRIDGAIAPSRALAEALPGVGIRRHQIHVVPPGVDIGVFVPGTQRDVKGPIIAVGRLVDKKAPLATISAFAQLARREGDARLVVIGDGPLRGACETRIRQLGIEEQVTLRRWRDHLQVQAAMMSASIFVQHSVTAPNGDKEGLPVAILEAMSSGLPVVSTRHSGIPEAVEHGVTGFLVDEGDVNSMAKALITLYQNADLRRTMGTAGRNRAVALFSRDTSLAKLRSVMHLTPTNMALNAAG
jgi:glycosyltransferase involved in cell wall biosynthesis